METTILLYARRYDFKDEAGKTVQGVNLQYLTGDLESSENEQGYPMITISAPFDVWGQLQAVPGVYDMEFKQRPGAKGRPTLQCVSASFREPFNAIIKQSKK